MNYERVEYFEKLIAIMEQLQRLVEEQANAPVDPADYAPDADVENVRRLQHFDAGHLCGAMSILRANINPDYAGLAAHDERDRERRLLRALALIKRDEAHGSATSNA